MDHSNIGDSSTGQSTQPAMSGNTRELATSLVEMKIASGDLSMDEAAASQGGDAQQPLGDTADALNEDPVTADALNEDLVTMDSEGSQEDPVIVDEYRTGPDEDAAAKVGDAKKGPGDATGQAGGLEEVLVRGKGVAQQK